MASFIHHKNRIEKKVFLRPDLGHILEVCVNSQDISELFLRLEAWGRLLVASVPAVCQTHDCWKQKLRKTAVNRCLAGRRPGRFLIPWTTTQMFSSTAQRTRVTLSERHLNTLPSGIRSAGNSFTTNAAKNTFPSLMRKSELTWLLPGVCSNTMIFTVNFVFPGVNKRRRNEAAFVPGDK